MLENLFHGSDCQNLTCILLLYTSLKDYLDSDLYTEKKESRVWVYHAAVPPIVNFKLSIALVLCS